jgi:ABC-type oligopeptide transport system substrate-binding subunit
MLLIHKVVSRVICSAGIAALLAAQPVAATTKGLSQIVTPDLQPDGELSLSFQAQSRSIANPYQLQAELGVTKWAEVALFQGLSPSEQILSSQIALVQQEPWLLTTGFINWSSHGGSPQPLLEGGYYTEHDKFMLGAIRVRDHDEAILGWAHDFNPTWRFQLDYQSGSENFFTVGFTCNVTDAFQFNPAVFFANDRTHSAVGYIVLTYTFKVWK